MRQMSDVKVRLSEIFTSMEGEGIFIGTKTLFVRMAGCPLGCYWCDTSYAIPIESGRQYSIEEVKTVMSKSVQPNTYKVNFTGGEPLLQHQAVGELARFSRSRLGLRTYLESSCYDSGRFSQVLPEIEICKVEFKTSDSDVVDAAHYQKLLQNEFDCLQMCLANGKMTYIKVVVTSSTSINEFRGLVRRIFELAKNSHIAGFIIQPSHNVKEPTLDRLFEFYDAVYPFYDQVRIIPQLHKLIGAR